jgi:hypothetical protein
MEEIGTSERWRIGKEHSGVCVALETVCAKGTENTLTDAKVESDSKQHPDCWGRHVETQRL